MERRDTRVVVPPSVPERFRISITSAMSGLVWGSRAAFPDGLGCLDVADDTLAPRRHDPSVAV